MGEASISRRYSFTALDTYKNCPYNYFLRYMSGNRANESTIALGIGSILHKGRELVSQALMRGEKPDYEAIKQVVMEGWNGTDKSGSGAEIILGINMLKSMFWEDWIRPEEGIPSYDERLKTYFEHLNDDEKDEEWRVIGTEQSFEVPFEDATLFGFIDKIEENKEGQLRITDYKSSKKVYDSKKLVTPLQGYIYWLAVQDMYPDREIESFWYDFIMLGVKRQGGTKGWLDRSRKQLTKLLSDIRDDRESGIWKPKPTPLCYWCSYCVNNPTADKKTRDLCPYYSLWMPERKSFEVAMKWQEGMKADAQKKESVFIF